MAALQELEAVVFDDGKPLTHTGVSHTLGVDANDAKEYLATFVKEAASQGKGLQVHYSLSGVDKNTGLYSVHVLPEKQLEEFRSRMSTVVSEHVFSVSAKPVEARTIVQQEHSRRSQVVGEASRDTMARVLSMYNMIASGEAVETREVRRIGGMPGSNRVDAPPPPQKPAEQRSAAPKPDTGGNALSRQNSAGSNNGRGAVTKRNQSKQQANSFKTFFKGPKPEASNPGQAPAASAVVEAEKPAEGVDKVTADKTATVFAEEDEDVPTRQPTPVKEGPEEKMDVDMPSKEDQVQREEPMALEEKVVEAVHKEPAAAVEPALDVVDVQPIDDAPVPAKTEQRSNAPKRPAPNTKKSTSRKAKKKVNSKATAIKADATEVADSDSESDADEEDIAKYKAEFERERQRNQRERERAEVAAASRASDGNITAFASKGGSKKRKIKQERTYVDEDGFMVTETVWVDDPEDTTPEESAEATHQPVSAPAVESAPEPAPKKAKVSEEDGEGEDATKKPKKAKAKAKSMTGQKSIMGFFAKK